jgi:importin-7
MQQEQPQFYTSLASHLSAEEQGVITTVVQQGEAIQAAAVAAQQSGAGVAVNGGSS